MCEKEAGFSGINPGNPVFFVGGYLMDPIPVFGRSGRMMPCLAVKVMVSRDLQTVVRRSGHPLFRDWR